MITYKKVYRLKKGMQLEWWVNQRPRYNDPGTRVTIYAREYLPETDSRLTDEIVAQNMELVGEIPCSTCIETCNLYELRQAANELQNFIDRFDQPPQWVIETLDGFVSESDRVQAERKSQEEAAARSEETGDRKAILSALEKLGKPQKSVTVPEEIPPDYYDPKVTSIRKHGTSVEAKLTDLYGLDPKYRDWTGPIVGQLIDETPDAIRMAKKRMRDKATSIQRKANETGA